jgi:hypothetical protein
MVALSKSRLLLVYVIASASIVGAITLLQYLRYNLFGTDLLLGWDSPRYVWAANEVMTKGSLSLIQFSNYPHLYIQLLAILGYVTGSAVIIERILPLVFSTLLIYANARITHKITKNVHIAGLAAILTAISINTLRLFADLHRNLMVLSLSFTSFLLISNFIDQSPFNKKSLLNKTYPAIIALFFVIAATQVETFVVLALTTILTGVLSRDWKKLVALTLPPTIPVAALLIIFPQLPQKYISQLGLFTRDLYFSEAILWTGGSWVLFGFLTAGATYTFYHAVKRRDTLASAIFSWAVVTSLLFILIIQRTIPLSAEYAVRALFILPVPVLFASAVSASVNVFKDVFFEIAVSSSTKIRVLRISFEHAIPMLIVSILVASSAATMYQHYDEFMTPYITKPGYDKIQAASVYLCQNGYSKPLVLVHGENANWFGQLYSSYLGAKIGSHYYYRADLNSLLHFSIGKSQSYQKAAFACPILLITPFLYDKEIPYCITQYHIGQGIYIIPPGSLISYEVDYGPAVTVTAGDGLREIRSEFLYVDQNDPSLVVLRVAITGHTSYTFEDYPLDWVFLKLEQGGALSYPERDPRRFDGGQAIEGNDPAESTQDWSTSQTASIRIETSPAKEGQANLKVEGFTDSWGNLGARYNPMETWDLNPHSSLAVWAKANENAPFSITLTDTAGNTRTYWDIKPDEASATTQWKRFTVSLNEYTSQNGNFEPSKVDSVDFYIYSNPGRKVTLCVDDPVIDDLFSTERAIYKARVSVKDLIIAYFAVKID